jgi:hypothetical protein
VLGWSWRKRRIESGLFHLHWKLQDAGKNKEENERTVKEIGNSEKGHGTKFENVI